MGSARSRIPKDCPVGSWYCYLNVSRSQAPSSPCAWRRGEALEQARTESAVHFDHCHHRPGRVSATTRPTCRVAVMLTTTGSTFGASKQGSPVLGTHRLGRLTPLRLAPANQVAALDHLVDRLWGRSSVVRAGDS